MTAQEKRKPRDKKALNIPVTTSDPDEAERQVAAFLQRPDVKATFAIRHWQGDLVREHTDTNELVKELEEQGAKAASGDLGRLESMLAIQAHTLDTLFNEYATLARQNLKDYFAASETMMRLALKAQSQCRATIETLAAVKNPPHVAFVKQANIAGGHQQVNNGDTSARAKEISANEVLEAHERLEHRATQTAGFGNPKVAALDPVHRTKDRRRQARG